MLDGGGGSLGGLLGARRKGVLHRLLRKHERESESESESEGSEGVHRRDLQMPTGAGPEKLRLPASDVDLGLIPE